MALMLCVLPDKVEVVNVATPDAVLPKPICVVPSKNGTASPSGTEPPEEAMVAVNVTASFNTEGDPDVVTFVVVADWLLGNTRKGTLLVIVTVGVVTVTDPVVAPVGTVAVM